MINVFLLCRKSLLVNVKYFYNQILSPDVSLGAHNYYTLSFIVDCISFIIIAVGFSSFGVRCISWMSMVNQKFWLKSVVQSQYVISSPISDHLFVHLSGRWRWRSHGSGQLHWREQYSYPIFDDVVCSFLVYGGRQVRVYLVRRICLYCGFMFCRAIYLRKFVTAKLIFYLFQLIIWHLWLFFILPSSPVTDKLVISLWHIIIVDKCDI